MKEEWIGLLDCNNFFVSCERLFRPDLQGKPVVVMSSNDGCIVARSQEVKDMGVPMGVPYFQVKDILNKAKTKAFSSHFALYRDISSRVFAAMREELDCVEEYSVDEAFFKVEGEPLAVASHLKQVVESRVGIPVSVGIAKTKTLSKYANTIAKKGTGTFHLTDDEWLSSQGIVPLHTIWGVGGRTEIAYKNHGILTAKDLICSDSARLKQLFGINGIRLQSELAGQPVLHINQARTDQKSIMNSRSFHKETEDLFVIKDAVAYHLRQSIESLKRANLKASSLRVYLLTSRHGDFLLRGGSNEVVLTVPTSSSRDLLAVANTLVDDLFEKDIPYKKAGVSLQGLLPEQINQGSLFTDTSDKSEAWKEVDELMSRLNKRGRDTLLIGSRLRSEDWKVKKESRSPAYTTDWKDLVEVKA